jgi:site-specific DNA-methyltransferase (adenine-specific)/adenine-specific DNA-methyltransferase
MEAAIARDITAERLRRVVEGHTWTDARGNPRQEAGLGGGFRYCTLGEPLFDAAGEIRPEVSFADLARHIFFVETGEPLPQDAPCASPLLGAARDTTVYLLYNGILRDTTPEAGNVLTPAVLAALPAYSGPKVVYGTGCLLSEARLREEGITFKQIPYAITTR